MFIVESLLEFKLNQQLIDTMCYRFNHLCAKASVRFPSTCGVYRQLAIIKYLPIESKA